jgi:hypothetical protein
MTSYRILLSATSNNDIELDYLSWCMCADLNGEKITLRAATANIQDCCGVQDEVWYGVFPSIPHLVMVDALVNTVYLYVCAITCIY